MKKIQRLFQEVHRLRTHRLMTAKQLADYLEVSPRTVYRDIQLLLDSGIPIKGETGTGYWLEEGFDFPPSLYTEQELHALVTGLRATMQSTDDNLANAALDVLKKIYHDAPQSLRKQMDKPPMSIPVAFNNPGLMKKITKLQKAIVEQKRIEFDYVDVEGQIMAGLVRPLELNYWGDCWSLVSYCHLHENFLVFRVERMTRLRPGIYFKHEPGKQLMDYYEHLFTHGKQKGEVFRHD